jgi:hypothetical protein
VQQGVAGGPEFVYRAQVRVASPDFELTLKSDWANHMPGARTEIEVLVRRRGGFAGPVKISAEGIPAGVRAEPLEIAAGAPSGKLVSRLEFLDSAKVTGVAFTPDGERMAVDWLDAARFADSNGYQVDRDRDRRQPPLRRGLGRRGDHAAQARVGGTGGVLVAPIGRPGRRR